MNPDCAAAEPEVIAHHFTEAGLDDLGIEWWGKAGDQALRRSAFQEAVAHLGKAIAMADGPGGGKTAAVSSERLQLQVAYANVLIAARGHGAPETAEAFAKARGSASGDEGASARLPAEYGLWAGCYVRASWRQRRRTRRHFLPTLKRNRTRPKQGLPIGRRERPIGLLEKTKRLEIISNARSPCSSPAGTTI